MLDWGFGAILRVCNLQPTNWGIDDAAADDDADDPADDNDDK